MDQPVEYDPQDIVPEAMDEEFFEDGELGDDPLEPFQETAFQKYWRENRLLNSMLMALVVLLILFGLIWNLILFQAVGIEQGTDFSDAGQQMSNPKQKKQQQVRLKQRQKKATPPSSSASFRAQAISDIAIPDIALNTKDINPNVEVDVNTDVGVGDVGVDLSALNNAFTSSFMGVQSQANRIAFIIDYSASMRGKDKVMRDELDAAVNKLPPAGEVCLIFFSGPSWLAGEDAKKIHNNWQGDQKKGWKPAPGFKPTKPKWVPVTPTTKKKLSKAIWTTPLTFGSVWDNSYRWALTMLNPKPDVIYFMTDGAAPDGLKGMEIIRQHRGRTKIYTIAYGTPDRAKIPLKEIADMTGGKFKFVSMEQIKNMEKKIKK